MLNMLGMAKIVLLTSILMNVMVFDICSVLSNWLHHCFLIVLLMIVDDVQDLRTSRTNLVQMNTRIIDRHKNWNILLFKEAIKIKEKKPILNTGFKTSKKLQLFWTDRVNNLWINLCKVPIVVQPISIQICTCCTSNFYALWRWFWWKSK